MDWGVFHVEHSFYDSWRRMQRCLKQRNAALRSGKANKRTLSAWDQELIEASELVDKARLRYFDSFYPVFVGFLERLVDLPDYRFLTAEAGMQRSL